MQALRCIIPMYCRNARYQQIGYAKLAATPSPPLTRTPQHADNQPMADVQEPLNENNTELLNCDTKKQPPLVVTAVQRARGEEMDLDSSLGLPRRKLDYRFPSGYALDNHKKRADDKRGNPLARKAASLRAALMRSVTRADVMRLGQALLERGLAGDVAAAKVLLSYTIGSSESVEVLKRLEGLELTITRTGPSTMPDDDPDPGPEIVATQEPAT
jgi:hypothetical protein